MKLPPIFILLLLCQQLTAQEILAQLQPGSSPQTFEDAGYTYRLVSRHQNIYALTGNSARSAQVNLNRAKKLPNVVQAQPNRPLQSRGSVTPNDPLYNQQWSLEHIGLPTLWDKTTGGTTPCGDEIVIAVFDDGFDLDHPDMQNQIWVNTGEIANNEFDDDGNGYVDDYFGLNVVDSDDNHLPDGPYHGPGVASIIGAATNNGEGMAGINWNVKLMIISAFEKDEAIAVEAFDYILDQRKRYNDSDGAEGAYVVAVNNSWGFGGEFADNFPLLCGMFDALGEAGILSVGATENSQANTDVFGDIPSDCPSDYLIVVTNTKNENDDLGVAGFGEKNVDLGAPGENIWVINSATSNGIRGGTSFATPHVTAAIGLLYSLPESTFCSDALTSPRDAALSMKRFILEGVKSAPELEGRTVSGGRLDLTQTVALITDVADRSVQSFDVSPVPADAYITLQLTDLNLADPVRYHIVDSRGVEVSQGIYSTSESNNISVSHLASGLYWIRVFDQQASAFVGRFIKF